MKKLLLSLLTVLSLVLTLFIGAPALAAVGSIALSATSGPVSSTVSVTGTGFTPGATFTVLYDGSPTTGGTGIIDTLGNLPSTWFIIPNSTAGLHTVMVSTTGPDTSNTIGFTVVPELSPSGIAAQVGDTLNFNGTGFAGSSTVTVLIDGSPLTSAMTSTAGGVYLSFAVPVAGAGFHTVTATDSVGNSAVATYTITQQIKLSQSSLAVGAQLNLTGNSFAVNSTVTIRIDGNPVTTTGSSSSGSFALALPVPEGVAGIHTISATDASSNTASTTYSIAPGVTVSPASFTGGSQVNITGTGFAGSSNIAVYVDNEVVNSSAATTTSLGAFSITGFTIPQISGGNHTLQAKDGSGNAGTFNFAVAANLTFDIAGGTPGTNLQVTGNGFGVNRPISISIDGIPVATNPPAPLTSVGGNFVVSFTVPPISGGNHPVVVSDGTNSASGTINVMPVANMTPITGRVGTSVTVGGSSFASGGSILITFDGTSVRTATADASGAFSATFEVPASGTGSHEIIVTDGTRKSTFSFAVTSTMTIGPLSGNAGAPITVTATGLAPGKQVTIKYDTTQAASATANATGGFAVTFNAPSSTGGAHSIILSDGTSTLVSEFKMDSASPEAPVLLAPLDKTQVAAETYFQWKEVTDPSGVTYVLQVSHDPNFSVLVLEKKGLTSPGFQLPETEPLPSASLEQPYYWRVKAVDGAFNESPWSTANSFGVGFVMEAWVQYIIFGFAVVLAGLLGYWLGLRKRLYARN